jgi:membrane protein implicated in regulation of membrane protease activity
VKRSGPISSDLVWLIAVLSMLFPWIAAGLALAGVYSLTKGDRSGWWMIAGGLVVAVIDVATDLWLAHPSVSASEEPDLNRRGAQYVGRVVLLAEAIESGRGKVRLGDTLWLVAGPDLPEGARVRIVAANGTVLVVEPA